MHKVLSKQNWLPIIILIFINIIFSIKYVARVSDYGIPLTLGYLLFQAFIFYSFERFPVKQKNLMLLYVLPVSFILIHITAFHFIDVNTLNVDRWSVIKGFWDNFINGIYPYYPAGLTANPPGPMPTYFLLAFPFYLIGEIGYYSILGFVLFYLFIRKHVKETKYQYLLISFMAISLCVNWEIAVRSTILVNSILFLFFYEYIEKIDLNKFKNLFISALIGGLLLSTRSIFIVSIIIFILYLIKNERISYGNSILFILFCLVFYMMPISFFALFYPNDFWKINPLIVQSEFLIPSMYIVLFIIIAFVLGFFSNTKYGLFRNTGLCLFLSIFIYFVYHIIDSGFKAALFDSKADISYFIFCIPFLLYSISLEREQQITY